VLLDFGATRAVAPEIAEQYRILLRIGLTGDVPAIRDALVKMGFISPVQVLRHGTTLDAMIGLAVSRIETSRNGLFDFADRDVIAMIRERATPMMADRASWHLPPADTLLIQRKIGGMALLLTNMRARLPLADTLARYS
jgi:hypothetical protein